MYILPEQWTVLLCSSTVQNLQSNISVSKTAISGKLIGKHFRWTLQVTEEYHCKFMKRAIHVDNCVSAIAGKTKKKEENHTTSLLRKGSYKKLFILTPHVISVSVLNHQYKWRQWSELLQCCHFKLIHFKRFTHLQYPGWCATSSVVAPSSPSGGSLFSSAMSDTDADYHYTGQDR